MKIFIGGSKMISELDKNVKERLKEIIKNNYDVLIGDCWGLDTAAQKFFAENCYRNVTIYVTGEKVRNNVGFNVCNIADNGAEGFEFFRQKDIAMANNADCGFMIWDKKSKGTLQNIIDLLNQKKPVEIYLNDEKTLKRVDEINSLAEVIYEAYDDVMEALK